MYTIGQFSKIGSISTKTLRYYDEIDLLKPTFVDEWTQYRYYSEAQVSRILLINELKLYGLRLEQIKVITDSEDIDLLKSFLQQRITNLDAETAKNYVLKESIEEKLNKIQLGGILMETNNNLNVKIKDLDPILVMSKRETINIEECGLLIGRVFEEIARQGLKAVGPLMLIYYDREFDHEHADIEACIPVDKFGNGCKTMERGTCACCTYKGVYSKLGEAYAKVCDYIEANKLEFSAPPFDIYISGPMDVEDMNDLITEVCFPVNK